MKYIKYALVLLVTVFLSACNTESSVFENKVDDNYTMTITVNHSDETLRSVEFEIVSLVPKEQASNFVESTDLNFTKKDYEQLEEFYSELNQFEGVKTKTKVKDAGDNVEVNITGVENVKNGKSIIGNTEKDGTFSDVKKFLTEQGFKEK
ncbi:hypothetical protein [Nosocomiicoccus sp. HMSC09A07]|uniref:hypothetical protein n=1 Tax=Nosocomiicoccus sp. HMSC09A07 TaxID=1581145 RepID=UPI0008A353C0|nr:hypothetical protein [Nosocomiicoccus sp. HMSC09A07]OFS62129.1 hypothetical protein HMPREF3177_06440 [Nosocomiicoccus sp. HMSC09A07]